MKGEWYAKNVGMIKRRHTARMAAARLHCIRGSEVIFVRAFVA
jgi:hypothetical protein